MLRSGSAVTDRRARGAPAVGFDPNDRPDDPRARHALLHTIVDVEHDARDVLVDVDVVVPRPAPAAARLSHTARGMGTTEDAGAAHTETSPLMLSGEMPFTIDDTGLRYLDAKAKNKAVKTVPATLVYGAVADGARVHVKAVAFDAKTLETHGIPDKGKPWYSKAKFVDHTFACASDADAAKAVADVRAWVAPAPQDIHVIVNPNSGYRKGKAVGELVEAHVGYSNHRVHVHFTRAPKDAIGIAAGLEIGEGGIIATVGGDGTMCEALQGLMQRPDAAAGRFTVCYIPCGSANAMSFMAGQGDTTTAIWAMLKGNAKPLDLFKFTQAGESRYGVLSVTSSLIADIDIDSEVCRCCGNSRFLLYTIMKLFCCCCTCCSRHANLSHPMTVEYKVPGSDNWHKWEGDAQFFQITNAPAIDEAMKIAPDARLNDGKLYITWSKPISRLAMVAEFDAVEEKRHLQKPNWSQQVATAVRVSNLTKYSKVVLDGEMCRAGESFEVDMMPSHVKLIVGSGSLPAFQ